MQHAIPRQQRGTYIQQFIEDFYVGNPWMLGCQKYKRDRPLTQALPEWAHVWGFLTDAFVNDNPFDTVHERPRQSHGRPRAIHRATPPSAPSKSSTLRHRVFGGLYRACPDNLPSGLRFEYRRFLCKRIDALPRLGGGLLDDDEFGESGHKESSRLLEFLVADFRERLDDAFDVLSRHLGRMLISDFLNEFRLRHQFGHVPSPIANQSVTTFA